MIRVLETVRPRVKCIPWTLAAPLQRRGRDPLEKRGLGSSRMQLNENESSERKFAATLLFLGSGFVYYALSIRMDYLRLGNSVRGRSRIWSGMLSRRSDRHLSLDVLEDRGGTGAFRSKRPAKEMKLRPRRKSKV